MILNFEAQHARLFQQRNPDLSTTYNADSGELVIWGQHRYQDKIRIHRLAREFLTVAEPPKNELYPLRSQPEEAVADLLRHRAMVGAKMPGGST
jgi:hypothetical protein